MRCRTVSRSNHAVVSSPAATLRASTISIARSPRRGRRRTTRSSVSARTKPVSGADTARLAVLGQAMTWHEG